MSLEVTIPSFGESISSGTISQWHKADGDRVEAGDALLTLETDKVSQEIEAEAGGILRIKAQEGEDVEIGAVVAVIEEGEGGASAPAEKKAVKEPSAQDEGGAEEKEERTEPEGGGEKKEGEEPDEMLVAPAVRQLAEEQGVDLSAIRGSGNRGRVTKADVETVLQKRKNEEARAERERQREEEEKATARDRKPSAPASAPASSSAAAEDGEERTTRKRMSPLRRKVATHLVNAQQTAAILTTFNECDMTEIMKLRKGVQEGFVEKHGVKLGFMSFFVKATVDALKMVPQVNAMIDGEDIVQNHFYDIGVAIGTERGLLVPVVRDCDAKSFADIEKDIINYANRAKDGKIELRDLQGGVFTISNGGVYGSLLSTPILNPPQSAILGMHTIQQRPVAVDGKVEIRPMMYLALSYDHRLIDGKEAVTFLIRIKDCIENPSRLLVGA